MIGEALTSFASTLWHSRRQSRTAFETWQKRALERWLARDLPRAPAYHDAPARLEALPITDKATLMADFAAYNIAGVTAQDAWAATRRDFRIGELTVGASTGTSGNRGLFIISEREKYRWLGSILAKTLADKILTRLRVAVILPQGTALYDSARRASRIDLRFYSLVDGPEAWSGEIARFAPNVIVAPPKVLRHLAEADLGLTPDRIFAGAETLDPVDRPVIEAGLGAPLGQIYMATEGLFAVTCRHGRLHLAEDSVFFEYEPVGDGLVTPLVTAFRRQTQIMARYRMNDLLRLSSKPCSCGSPLQSVDEVVGRMDDVFRFEDVMITPDVLRNAVLDAARSIDDFRIQQTGANAVILRLPPHIAEPDAKAAQTALQRLLDHRRTGATVRLEQAPLPLDPSRKLRRVERVMP